VSGSDIVPALSDPIDCSWGYSSGDVCCAKGTNSVPAWIIFIVGDCLLDQRPTLCREGWYQRDETDRRGARGGRPDGWSGVVDTDAEDHCADPEVDVFRGDAVAIYISNEGAVLVILLVTPTTQLATTISLLFTDRGWYPYTNGIVFILTVVVVGCTC
jgi:hypothetical protein